MIYTGPFTQFNINGLVDVLNVWLCNIIFIGTQSLTYVGHEIIFMFNVIKSKLLRIRSFFIFIQHSSVYSHASNDSGQ